MILRSGLYKPSFFDQSVIIVITCVLQHTWRSETSEFIRSYALPAAMWMQESVTYLPHSVRRHESSLNGFSFPFNSSGFYFIGLLVWINSLIQLFGGWLWKPGQWGVNVKIRPGCAWKDGAVQRHLSGASSPPQDSASVEVVSRSGQDTERDGDD